MRKIILTFMFCASFVLSIMAQTTITGQVTDEFGNGLPGVSVIEKGTLSGTTTDIDGKFKLDVSSGNAVLQFSFVGMTPKEIPVAGQTTVNITMSEDVEALDEVVVTALGISREKKSLGYSVTEVGSEDISVVKDHNPANSLVGKIAGVTISNSGAGPGSGSRIVIRGNNSINGENQPLIVVDGIPIDRAGTNSGGNVYSSRVTGGGISDINADDIESLSVLKGPNASALYGSRAANGVILITTKKGTSREGIGVSINSSFNFDSPMQLPDYQDEYGQGERGNHIITQREVEGVKVWGFQEDGSWGPKFDGTDQIYYTGENHPYVAQKDNVKDFFGTAARLINTVSLEGGSENFNMRFSYTNNYSESILPNSDLTSHNFNLRSYLNLTDKLNLDAKVTYLHQELKNPIAIGSEGIMAYVLTMPRNVDINDLKTYQRFEETGFYESLSYSQPGANPYWILKHDKYTDKRERFIGFAKLTYKFNDWLSVFARLGTDVTRTNFENKTNYGHHFSKKGAYSVGNSRNVETNADILLMFQKDLNKNFNLMVNVGASHTYTTRESIGISGRNFKIPTRATVTNLLDLDSPNYVPKGEKKLNSIYASSSLSYKDFLYLDLTARNDWSSTLGPGNRSFIYPSVSLSAVLSQAFELPEFVNYLKVYGSWADAANSPDLYVTSDQYYLVAGQGYLGLTELNKLSTLLNKNLEPEHTTSIESGLEFRMLNNRLFGEFSLYRIKTTDLIYNIPVDPNTGYQSVFVNIGEMKNKGFEFRIGGIPVKNDNFSWETSLNFSRNKNELNKLTEDIKRHTLLTSNSGNVRVQASVGDGYADIYTQTWKRTKDGQLHLTGDGKPQRGEEYIKAGNAQPDFLAGLTNTLTYKNISLRFLIDGRFGGEIYSQTSADFDANGVSKRSLQYRETGIVVDGVIENDDGTFSKNDKSITAQDYWEAVSTIASEYVYKQTNIRLREFVLSYQIPHSLLSKTFIKSATVGLVGKNLFFFYKDMDDNLDPEGTLGTNNSSQGILSYNLPTVRSIGFNVNVKF